MPKANSKKSSAQALTHFDASGQAHMVDVADKAVTRRVAIASGRITMQATTLELIAAGTSKKGDVLGIARIAAIQGAKRTSDLIPLCHPIAMTRIANAITRLFGSKYFVARLMIAGLPMIFANPRPITK